MADVAQDRNSRERAPAFVFVGVFHIVTMLLTFWWLSRMESILPSSFCHFSVVVTFFAKFSEDLSLLWVDPGLTTKLLMTSARAACLQFPPFGCSD